MRFTNHRKTIMNKITEMLNQFPLRDNRGDYLSSSCVSFCGIREFPSEQTGLPSYDFYYHAYVMGDEIAVIVQYEEFGGDEESPQYDVHISCAGDGAHLLSTAEAGLLVVTQHITWDHNVLRPNENE